MQKSLWTELVELDRPLMDLFRSFPTLPMPALVRPYWPALDVFKRGADMVVTADLPGIDPARDVTVTIEDGELVIRGERTREERVEQEGYLRMESLAGSFERHLPIPSRVKEADITATYADGVLTVVVPGGMKPVEKPRSIPIVTSAREPVAAPVARRAGRARRAG